MFHKRGNEMTRGEAIEFGRMWLELQEDCKDSNTYEFFKMAIEALQQEPTYTSEVAQKAYEDGKKDGYIQRKIETIDENDLRVDCISRKAVIDAINANCVWENEYNLTSSRIKKAVENLPSVTPQEPSKDIVSRSEIKRIAKEMYLEVANMEFDAKTISDCISCTSSKCREVLERKLQTINSVTPQKPRKGEWLRMSDLSEQEDDRYKCSRCGNVIHYKDKMNLYTFNSWCGRCGSDNGRKIEVTV